jgi:hypothetical protein
LKRVTILSLFILLCSSVFTQSQAPRSYKDDEVFESLRSSTISISKALGQTGFSKVERRTVNDLLDNIAANTRSLRETARRRKASTIPPEYLESLKLNAELLMSVAEELLNSSYSRTRVIAMLTHVAEDLSTKVIFSQRLMGAGLRLVEFVVHTKKDGKEHGGYEVWYVPRGWLDTPDKFRRSDYPSSPAIMKLAPGNYMVWLKKDKVTTEKVPYTLGKDGSRKTIVFPIP